MGTLVKRVFNFGSSFWVALLSFVLGIGVLISPRLSLGVLATVLVTYILFSLSGSRLVLFALIVSLFSFSYNLFIPINPAATPLIFRVIREMVVLFAFLGVATEWLVARRPIPVNRGGLVGILIFACYVCISALLPTRVPFLARLTEVRYWVFYPLLVLLVPMLGQGADLGCNVVRQIRSALTWGLCVVAAIAPFDFLQLLGFTYQTDNLAVGPFLFRRAISTLGNPNNFALVLGWAILFQLAPQFVEDRAYRRTTGRLALILLMLAFLLTFSRSAFICLNLISLLLWLFVARRKIPTAIVVTVFTLILTAAVLSSYTARGVDISHAGGWLAAENRIGYWKESRELMTDTWTHFFFGNGVGYLTSSLEIAGERSLLQETGIREGNVVPDNFFLTLSVETGLFGLLFFGWAVLVPIIRLGAALRQAQNVSLKALGYGLLGAEIYSLGMGTFIPVFSSFPGAFIFWVALGANFVLASALRRSRGAERRRSLRSPESGILGPRGDIDGHSPSY